MKKSFLLSLGILVSLVFLAPFQTVKAGGNASSLMPKTTLFFLHFKADAPHPFAEQARTLINNLFYPSSVQATAADETGISSIFFSPNQIAHLDLNSALLPYWRPFTAIMGTALSSHDSTKVVRHLYLMLPKSTFDDYLSRLKVATYEKYRLPSGFTYYRLKNQAFYFAYQSALMAVDDEATMIDLLNGAGSRDLTVTELENYGKVINNDGDSKAFLGGFFNFDLMRQYVVGTVLKSASLQTLQPGSSAAAGEKTLEALAQNPLILGLHAGGFSVEEKNGRFEILMNVVKDPMSSTTEDLAPALYKRISPDNVIFFYEGTNLQDSFQLALKNMTADQLTQWNTVKNKIETETELSFDNDILPLFKKRFALVMKKKDSGQNADEIPSVSLIFEIDPQTDLSKIKAELSKVASQTESGPKFGVIENRFFIISTEDPAQVLLPSESDAFTQSTFSDGSPFAPDMLKQLLTIKFNSLLTELYNVSSNPFTKALKNITVMAYENSLRVDIDTNLPSEPQCAAPAASQGDENQQESAVFQDVETNDWFAPYVQDLESRGTLHGYKLNGGLFFKPSQLVSRAEFATMLTKNLMSNYQDDQEVQTYFKDVQPCDWYAPSVNKELLFGFVNGYKDNTFRPNAPITRAEALQMLWQQNYLLRQDTTANGGLPFGDVKVSDWFYQAVKSFYDLKLIDGASMFRPHDFLTRSEAAKVISQVYQYQQKTEAASAQSKN